MASKNTQVKQEMEMNKTQEYLKEYQKAYDEHITPINVKYSLRLIPTIVHNKVGGMNPAYGIEQYTREEVTPQDPPNENIVETKAQ
jgi:hypothetical protein